MKSEVRGYRGYLGSRPLLGRSFPQRVQNLVVRDYAATRGLPFKLSLTEYAMPGCYMILQTLLDELPKLDGIVVFSMFMLPGEAVARRRIYERVIGSGCTLHAALERSALTSASDIAKFEDTVRVARALAQAPAGGRFEKTGHFDRSGDRFFAALNAALGNPRVAPATLTPPAAATELFTLGRQPACTLQNH